jgi:hypothetical protein
MQTKDWILLLVPILCNGFIVFFVQWLFDKKKEKDKAVRDNKMYYYDTLRMKIDDALSLHSDLCEISNKKNSNVVELMNTINQFYNSTQLVYKYYRPNYEVFDTFKEEADSLSNKIFELNRELIKTPTELNFGMVSRLLNETREVLVKMKEKCIDLKGV